MAAITRKTLPKLVAKKVTIHNISSRSVLDNFSAAFYFGNLLNEGAFMKPLIALFVFILALGLSYQTIAAEPAVCTAEKTENCSPAAGSTENQSKEEHHAAKAGHGAAHEDHHAALAAKMNSLFPEKQKNPAAVVRPEPTKLVAPKFLDKVAGGVVKLTWAAAANATTYHVQVATDPNFKWLVANELSVAGTSYDVAKLEAGKRYFWRVASVKADNDSMYTKSLFVSSAFDIK